VGPDISLIYLADGGQKIREEVEISTRVSSYSRHINQIFRFWNGEVREKNEQIGKGGAFIN